MIESKAEVIAVTPDADGGRRQFLKTAGVGIGVATAYFSGLDTAFAQFGVPRGSVDVGTGDFGVLNYAFALEQLETAFYSQVLATPYSGMTAYELQIFTSIQNNEMAHRDFLAFALLIARIPKLETDFSRVNFNSRSSVLSTSRMFEDLGVSAYNGAGHLIKNPLYLSAAGSIVSIEARQAAIIRDIISPLSGAFAGDDVVNSGGLEVPPRLPSQVLPRASKYIATPLTANSLP